MQTKSTHQYLIRMALCDKNLKITSPKAEKKYYTYRYKLQFQQLLTLIISHNLRKFHYTSPIVYGTSILTVLLYQPLCIKPRDGFCTSHFSLHKVLWEVQSAVHMYLPQCRWATYIIEFQYIISGCFSQAQLTAYQYVSLTSHIK